MRCSKCGSDKPVDAFARDASRTSGRFPWCRECKSAYTNARNSALSFPKDVTRLKVCPGCGEEKSGHHFYHSRANRGGLSSQCRACRIAGVILYRKGNPDAARGSSRAYKKSRPEVAAAGRAVRRAIARGWLERLPCDRCGESKTQAHHHISYAKEHQLNVVWLCHSCHLDWHSVFGKVE